MRLLKKNLSVLFIITGITCLLFVNLASRAASAGMWSAFPPLGTAGFLDGSVQSLNPENITGLSDNKYVQLSPGQSDDITSLGYNLNGNGTINHLTLNYIVDVQGEFAQTDPDVWEAVYSADGGLTWLPAFGPSSLPTTGPVTVSCQVYTNPATGAAWTWNDFQQLRLKLTRTVVGAPDNISVSADSFYITVNYQSDDLVPPRVVQSAPIAGSLGVPVNAKITVDFNEPINEGTLSDATVCITDEVYNTVSGSIYYDPYINRLTFTPAENLAYNTRYMVTLTSGIQDPAGNALPETTWDFLTEADQTIPQVLGVKPADGSSGVTVDTCPSVQFNEPVSPQSLNSSTFTVTEKVYGDVYDMGRPVNGSVVYNPLTKTAVFIPAGNFPYMSEVTVTVQGVADPGGNQLPGSRQWQFITRAEPTAVPAPPTGVMARGISPDSIGISWTQAEDAVSYEVYRGADPAGPYSKISATAKQSATYCVDSGLTPATSYFYKVRAVNAQGYSGFSTAATYSYTDWAGQARTDYLNKGTTLRPEQPVDIKAVAGDVYVTVSWSAAPGSANRGFNVYRAVYSGGPYTKVNTSELNSSTLEFVDTSVENCKLYYYCVTAVSSNGAESAKSVEAWAKPKGLPYLEVPHISGEKNNNVCAICHKTHLGSGIRIIRAETVQKLCINCHDGTSSRSNMLYEFGNMAATHSIMPDTADSVRCSYCHEPRLDYEEKTVDGTVYYPKLLKAYYNNTMYYKGNQICYKCHGSRVADAGDKELAFENGIHRQNMPLPKSGTEIQCLNCHFEHASPNESLLTYKQENTCFPCHNKYSPYLSIPDVMSQINRETDAVTRHDILSADQAENGSYISCSNCHNAHGVTRTGKLFNPDYPSGINVWKGSLSSFCLKCHDGVYPSALQVSPFNRGIKPGPLVLTNVQEKYRLGFDGAADRHGESAGASAWQDPIFGFDDTFNYQNRVLPCGTCHEPHGSDNAFHLKSSMISGDGSLVRNGLFIYHWKYRDAQGPNVGADARLFCNACHGARNMGNTKPWPTNCFAAGCHGHGRNF